MQNQSESMPSAPSSAETKPTLPSSESEPSKPGLLGNRLLVKPFVSGVVGRGIAIPQIALEAHKFGGPTEYQVEAKGPGRLLKNGVRVPIEANVGDRVICHSYTTGAQEIAPGWFIITDDQILAVVEEGT